MIKSWHHASEPHRLSARPRVRSDAPRPVRRSGRAERPSAFGSAKRRAFCRFGGLVPRSVELVHPPSQIMLQLSSLPNG